MFLYKMIRCVTLPELIGGKPSLNTLVDTAVYIEVLMVDITSIICVMRSFICHEVIIHLTEL